MPDNTVTKYDRLRGGLEGVALFAKCSTVRNIETITGRAETFMIETGRHAELGDYIFVECTDETGTTRICLPPKVAGVIESQREALTTRRRRIAGKTNIEARIQRGEDVGKALREYRKKRGK